jgi:hypothetical protein
MTSSFLSGLVSGFFSGLRVLAAPGIACAFIAGCGGGGGGGGGTQLPAMLPVAATPPVAVAADGAAPEQAPIGSAPCASCAAGGTDVPAVQPNSRLDCAP